MLRSISPRSRVPFLLVTHTPLSCLLNISHSPHSAMYSSMDRTLVWPYREGTSSVLVMLLYLAENTRQLIGHSPATLSLLRTCLMLDTREEGRGTGSLDWLEDILIQDSGTAQDKYFQWQVQLNMLPIGWVCNSWLCDCRIYFFMFLIRRLSNHQKQLSKVNRTKQTESKYVYISCRSESSK